MQFAGKIIASILLLVSVLCGSPILGKGLGDLKPDHKAVDQAKDQGSEKVKPSSTAQDGKPAAKPNAALTAKAAKTAIAPSALSKRLADRLTLSLDFGYASISDAGDAELDSSAMAAIGIAWKYLVRSSWGAAASLRYAPMNFTGTSGSASYRGVIEAYLFGTFAAWHLGSMELLAGLEAGAAMVASQQLDNLDHQDAPEETAVAFGAMTGLDWGLADKIKLGPRIYALFGTYQMVQITGSATFMF